MSDTEGRIEIHTLKNPMLYSPRQLHIALLVAKTINADELYLFERPKP